VLFLSAVGNDERGARALDAVSRTGVRAELIARTAAAPTGTVRVSVDDAGQPAFTIERPAAYDFAELTESGAALLAAWKPEWVYFGTLYQAQAGGTAVAGRVFATLPGVRRFFDVNLRRDSYTPELAAELMRRADVLKLNEDEVRVLAPVAGAPPQSVERFCEFCAREYGCEAVAVTLGERGCAVRSGREYTEAPGYRVRVKDTVGAGDAFAAAFLHGVANGWPAPEVADFSNRAGAVVASHAGAIPEWTIEDARRLRRRTRGAGSE